MRSYVIFSSREPVLVLTRKTIRDKAAQSQLGRIGISKFIAREVPVCHLRDRYGRQFDVIENALQHEALQDRFERPVAERARNEQDDTIAKAHAEVTGPTGAQVVAMVIDGVEIVDGGAWVDLFETTVCGDDSGRRKPNPDPILKALENLGVKPAPNCWYVGDSTTDTIAAKRAGITSVFFNGAQWDQHLSSAGMAFKDKENCIAIYSDKHDPTQENTCREIARFSLPVAATRSSSSTSREGARSMLFSQTSETVFKAAEALEK